MTLTETQLDNFRADLDRLGVEPEFVDAARIKHGLTREEAAEVLEARHPPDAVVYRRYLATL